MDYDVFLCCSSEDHETVGRGILDRMEANGYRVCYHYTDFLPGTRILDNIAISVTRSKRTVCLLTENFIQRFEQIATATVIASSKLPTRKISHKGQVRLYFIRVATNAPRTIFGDLLKV